MLKKRFNFDLIRNKILKNVKSIKLSLIYCTVEKISKIRKTLGITSKILFFFMVTASASFE